MLRFEWVECKKACISQPAYNYVTIIAFLEKETYWMLQFRLKIARTWEVSKIYNFCQTALFQQFFCSFCTRYTLGCNEK